VVDVATVSDQVLVSPSIALPNIPGGLTLQFWNHQTIESRAGGGCWDGAVLEISTNDGATWTRLEAQLQTDPYHGAIQSGFQNPLAGSNGWCGDPQDWLNSVVALDAFAGQTVRFRFRLGTDSIVGREGWYIDDVRVQACVTGEIFVWGFDDGGYGGFACSGDGCP
jgi:lysyl endopeptidase